LVPGSFSGFLASSRLSESDPVRDIKTIAAPGLTRGPAVFARLADQQATFVFRA